MGKENGITIDRMRKEDVDQVLAIEQASFTMPWSRNLFLSEFRSPGVSHLLVALDGPVRTVVGFIVFWLVEDEMHLLNLAVAQTSRRRGIGRRLVMSAMRSGYSKGAKRVFLEVRLSNVGAQKLYLSLGFTGASLRRDYYDSPVEDAVVMVLEKSAFESLMRAENTL